MRVLSLFILFCTALLVATGVSASPVSIVDIANFKTALHNDGENLIITIKAPQAHESEIFEVEGPKRIVVDVPTQSTKLNKSVTGNSPDLISGIRFGTHPHKIRMVVDVASNEIGYKTENKRGVLTVTIFKNNAIFDTPKNIEKVPVTPIVEATATPTLSPSPIITAPSSPTETATPLVSPTIRVATTETPAVKQTLLPSRTPTAVVTMTPTALNTATPTSTASPAPTATPTMTPEISATPTPIEKVSPHVPVGKDLPMSKTLTGIDFQIDEGQSIASLTLSERSQFKLTRDRERRYTLFIPSFTLSNPGLALPHFPPNDVVGFTLIQISQKDGGVEVTIGLDDGMKAVAVNKENSILIKAVAAGF